MTDNLLEKSRFRLYEYIPLAILFISLCLNVYLGITQIKLRQELSMASTAAATIPITEMAHLSVYSVDGDHRMLAFLGNNTPTIVYFFSPSCEWCDRNRANIDALARQSVGRYAVYGVSITSAGIREYDKSRSPSFPIYVLGSDAPASLRFSSTPTMLVVDRTGKVIRTWHGAFMGQVKTEVQDFFGCVLPGLSTIADSGNTGEKHE